uniref:Uncharacterized protein n=1 Tax=Chromera velia CCMP2878 TaxID=1169474 RepID=A0A0G4GD08_9ALVE|eukprot:Cvel_21257.t1-p1 / transcript=Cvel_21257.t1 / gene=Cvel_21257 / organism=Chromera_velia_CCMP2878 / gene_product=hypothetical protein / transcript_product=hypothetical protein / location=Cvel_scaffold1977:24975-28301(-) / protein_length=674 / sequence_SO=supercontig / SO=protein_coding / is_pseudo=false
MFFQLKPWTAGLGLFLLYIVSSPSQTGALRTAKRDEFRSSDAVLEEKEKLKSADLGTLEKYLGLHCVLLSKDEVELFESTLKELETEELQLPFKESRGLAQFLKQMATVKTDDKGPNALTERQVEKLIGKFAETKAGYQTIAEGGMWHNPVSGKDEKVDVKAEDKNPCGLVLRALYRGIATVSWYEGPEALIVASKPMLGSCHGQLPLMVAAYVDVLRERKVEKALEDKGKSYVFAEFIKDVADQFFERKKDLRVMLKDLSVGDLIQDCKGFMRCDAVKDFIEMEGWTRDSIRVTRGAWLPTKVICNTAAFAREAGLDSFSLATTSVLKFPQSALQPAGEALDWPGEMVRVMEGAAAVVAKALPAALKGGENPSESAKKACTCLADPASSSLRILEGIADDPALGYPDIDNAVKLIERMRAKRAPACEVVADAFADTNSDGWDLIQEKRFSTGGPDAPLSKVNSLVDICPSLGAWPVLQKAVYGYLDRSEKKKLKGGLEGGLPLSFMFSRDVAAHWAAAVTREAARAASFGVQERAVKVIDKWWEDEGKRWKEETDNGLKPQDLSKPIPKVDMSLDPKPKQPEVNFASVCYFAHAGCWPIYRELEKLMVHESVVVAKKKGKSFDSDEFAKYFQSVSEAKEKLRLGCTGKETTGWFNNFSRKRRWAQMAKAYLPK